MNFIIPYTVSKEVEVFIIPHKVCLGAILIPEYPDFHSGYSAPRSIIISNERALKL